MLSIRLSRIGRKNAPSYRIVVMEKQRDPYAPVLETLGHYNPRSKQCECKADRITYWISNGAQATDTVWNILVDQKIVEGKKRAATRISKKRAVKLQDNIAAAKAKEEAAKAKAEEEKKAAEEAAAAKAAAPAEEPKTEA